MSQANESPARGAGAENRLGAIPISPSTSVNAANETENRCLFRVWAPNCEKVEVHLLGAGPADRFIPMARDARGYHQALVADVEPGALYFYRLNGEKDRPDPASQSQPRGVHGPSQVVRGGQQFAPADANWKNLPLASLIIYELHVGTFSTAGTFDGVIAKLDVLCDLGVNAIEIMPVAQFPGARNWGYDGVFLYAVQNSYGGPEGLRRLVEACHARGLAVILDVVYNHLGPEGNYLSEYAPYFTDRYRTGWGGAINVDGPHSDEVRNFICENARFFVREFHIDGLRLDAVHAIYDVSARPFLRELAAAVSAEAETLGRPVHVIAESDGNDARLVAPPAQHGYGLSAQWSDDFHHALHTLITGERNGYYADFGEFSQLVKAVREGFVYTGEYAPSRQRRHGSSANEIPPQALVVCAQNHDQIGNRMRGDRLPALVAEAELKLAAATLLLGPFVPLLFMGEEYGESAPFQYFVSHGDEGLIEAVRRGRREEFSAFSWQGEPPDPQAEATFERSRINHELRKAGMHARIYAFYKELIRLRRSVPALGCVPKKDTTVVGLFNEVLLILRTAASDQAASRSANTAANQDDNQVVKNDNQVVILLHFGKSERAVSHALPEGRWHKLLDTTDALPAWFDSIGELQLILQPGAVVVYERSLVREGARHE